MSYNRCFGTIIKSKYIKLVFYPSLYSYNEINKTKFNNMTQIKTSAVVFYYSVLSSINP